MPRSRLEISRRTFCLSALSAAGLTLGAAEAKKAARPPNVVLIVLDTVRADHLGPWGYKRRTSPLLDAFAGESTVYSQARSTCPWTLPSHVTIFTGQYSFQHGVEASVEPLPDGQLKIHEPAVPNSAVMLAETLKSAGYATGAFTANTAYMTMPWNFSQGFDLYEVNRRPGVELLKPIGSWLRERSQAPFFLFVNFMDAHFPYNTNPCPGAFEETVSQNPDLIKVLIRAVMPGEKPADPVLLNDVTAQYDMGVANADYAAGHLLQTLRQLGSFDDTLVIVTADHGEYLGEHLLVQHSKDLYEQVLHVPLFIKYPGQKTGRVDSRPVSLVQLSGTVQRTLGIENPTAAPHLDADQPLVAEINYSRAWDMNHEVWGRRFNRLRTAYYEYPWKLIHSSDGKHELYNLAEDPSESKSLFTASPDRAGNLLANLQKIKPLSQPAPVQQPAPKLSEQDFEALKANGYL